MKAPTCKNCLQIESGNGEGYSSQDMDLEIQRVARELYKAFSGLNEEFERPQDQVGEYEDCTLYQRASEV